MKRSEEEIIREFLSEDIKRYQSQRYPGDLVYDLANALPSFENDVSEYKASRYPGDLIDDITPRLNAIDQQRDAVSILHKILSKDVELYRQERYPGKLAEELSTKLEEQELSKKSILKILFVNFKQKRYLALAASILLVLSVWMAWPKSHGEIALRSYRGFAMRSSHAASRTLPTVNRESFKRIEEAMPRRQI